MNGEREARHALRQDRQHPARVVLPLTANDEVIGNAAQQTAPPHPWLDLPLSPFIPPVLQEQIRPQGCEHAPLRAAALGVAQGVPCQHPGLQPRPDQPQDRAILDPLREHFPPQVVLQAVNEYPDIGVHDPTDVLMQAPRAQHVPVVMRAATLPDAVRALMTVLLIKRSQQHRHCPLDDRVRLDGALASSRVSRQALIDQHSGFILATNALNTTHLSPHEGWAGYKGQGHGARGCRWLKDPQLFASALSLKKPERIMALWMVMTLCLLVDAALESRIRQVLTDQEATFPDQQGKRLQQPTARWVFHDFVGMPLRCQAGQWPMVLTLTADHQPLRRRLGQAYMWFYDVQYS